MLLEKKRPLGLHVKPASLPGLLLPGQSHRGQGWHWAVPWLLMGMHSGPVPNKVLWEGRIEEESQILTLLLNFPSPGPLLLQWEPGQTRIRGWACLYLCACSV